MTQNDNIIQESGNLTIPRQTVNGYFNTACITSDTYGDIGDSTRTSKRKFRYFNVKTLGIIF